MSTPEVLALLVVVELELLIGAVGLLARCWIWRRPMAPPSARAHENDHRRWES